MSPEFAAHPHSVPAQSLSGLYYLDFSNILGGANEVAKTRYHRDIELRLHLAEMRNLGRRQNEPLRQIRATCVIPARMPLVPVVGAAERAGWKVNPVEVAPNGAEKEADTTLVSEMAMSPLLPGVSPKTTTVTLFSGDRDFRHVVKQLKALGFLVIVMAWNHSTSHRLREAASLFVPLDSYFDRITYLA
ncbi:NYN domain-containing protein [Thioalkalicoccus limnaeus]|uniref:NYN domain-containing protein n=1 Tax=Thioalkalicoccus limnaeus TaxID=120681 RepID=A0ABV4BAA3_9GAMM